MSIVEILLLALALSADAFTVAAGIGLRHRSRRQRFRLSFHFGLFQSLMSGAGALAGTLVVSFMQSVDHWIAFGLLVIIGARMIYASRHVKSEARLTLDLTRGLTLVSLSIAVSIDAFAAGIGLPAANAPILLAVIIIGAIAAIATFVAMRLAGRIPAHFAERLEITAGLILIGLGTYILLAHLF